MRLELKTEKPPIYFVPTRMICSCGQSLMVIDSYVHPSPMLALDVWCTNPNCNQENISKRVDIAKFAFTEYELL